MSEAWLLPRRTVFGSLYANVLRFVSICRLSLADSTIDTRLVLSYILKQPILGLTQEWFRELAFSRPECGVHDRIDIYPLCGNFYFPWHRHQIEVTNGFKRLLRKTLAKRGKRNCPSFEAAIQPLSYHAPQEIHNL